MKVYSNSINSDGYLDNSFGGNSTNESYFINGTNVRSFHIGWKDLPKNTKSLAIHFFDYDAIPVCGFAFLHWSVANIDPSISELKENASIELKDKLIQGKNSYSSKLLGDGNSKIEDLYIGCAPPNGDHIYDVVVYALDKKLDLKNGFYVNELMNKLRDGVIEKATLTFKYRQINK